MYELKADEFDYARLCFNQRQPYSWTTSLNDSNLTNNNLPDRSVYSDITSSLIPALDHTPSHPLSAPTSDDPVNGHPATGTSPQLQNSYPLLPLGWYGSSLSRLSRSFRFRSCLTRLNSKAGIIFNLSKFSSALGKLFTSSYQTYPLPSATDMSNVNFESFQEQQPTEPQSDESTPLQCTVNGCDVTTVFNSQSALKYLSSILSYT
jgi:hypothetical protein